MLSLPKITDRYEVKARLVPALISCLIAVPGVAALFSLGIPNWLLSLSAGGTVAVVLAVGLSYGSSMAGRKYEASLWTRWPYDAPTNVWLYPDDSQRSQEQKSIWYQAIHRLTGLNIAQAAVEEDREELERVINDAVVALRTRLRDSRKTEHSRLLAIHNEDYGFARNFAGLGRIWFTASVISAIVSWGGYLAFDTWMGWGVVAALFLALAILLLFNLQTYVLQRADRYAESFYGAVMALDRMNSETEK